MIAVFTLSVALIVWVYAGYPLALGLLGRLRPRPRLRAPCEPSLSIVIAAHDEVAVIADKVADVWASEYRSDLIELIVASDGSEDGTVEAARRAGASQVLDLPRIGKLAALNRAAQVSSGEILVFTDADSLLEPGTLRELTSNFADETIGGVAANVVRCVAGGRAAGRPRRKRLLALRTSAQAPRGPGRERRLGQRPPVRGAPQPLQALDAHHGHRRLRDLEPGRHRRLLDSPSTSARSSSWRRPEQGHTELRRKIRVMNRGMRSAFALGLALLPTRTGLYGVEVVCHKILRRFVAFFLLAALVSSAVLAAGDPTWWIALAPQLAFYALALVGGLLAGTRWGRLKPLWIPYFFCLANLAAALAVLSLLGGVRFERWEPVGARGSTRSPAVRS